MCGIRRDLSEHTCLDGGDLVAAEIGVVSTPVPATMRTHPTEDHASEPPTEERTDQGPVLSVVQSVVHVEIDDDETVRCTRVDLDPVFVVARVDGSQRNRTTTPPTTEDDLRLAVRVVLTTSRRGRGLDYDIHHFPICTTCR